MGSTAVEQRLAGIYEISEYLINEGHYDSLPRARSTLTTWISRRHDVKDKRGKIISRGNGFPEPVVQLKSGGVYDLNVVIPWIAQHYARQRGE